MPTLTQGKHDQFFWLQRSIETEGVDLPLIRLTKDCSEVLLGKHLLVTSLDSGSLRLKDQQIDQGWRREGKVAASPRITNVSDAPFQWFDEWYIFADALPEMPEVQVFVNYGAFSLGEANSTIDTVYVGPDDNIETEMAAAVAALQKRFWTQLESLNPESYVANGNCFIFVTRDAQLHEKVSALMSHLVTRKS